MESSAEIHVLAKYPEDKWIWSPGVCKLSDSTNVPWRWGISKGKQSRRTYFSFSNSCNISWIKPELQWSWILFHDHWCVQVQPLTVSMYWLVHFMLVDFLLCPHVFAASPHFLCEYCRYVLKAAGRDRRPDVYRNKTSSGFIRKPSPRSCLPATVWSKLCAFFPSPRLLLLSPLVACVSRSRDSPGLYVFLLLSLPVCARMQGPS